MNNEKMLLIIEKSAFNLQSKGLQDRSDGKKYIILEGTFGVLNELNRNKRIYTKEQYVPWVNALQEEIQGSSLLGELNHPLQRFDVDLNCVSHVIEKLEYDENTERINGRIRLLNTPAGKIAQSLVEDGIPLNISSRAAGSVNEDGTVIMKQLFTYDIVAKPGFKQAQLNRVNEKYGYGDCDIDLYEIDELDEAAKKKNEKIISDVKKIKETESHKTKIKPEPLKDDSDDNEESNSTEIESQVKNPTKIKETETVKSKTKLKPLKDDSKNAVESDGTEVEDDVKHPSKVKDLDDSKTSKSKPDLKKGKPIKEDYDDDENFELNDNIYNKNKNINMDYITREQFERYTQYLRDKVDELNERLDENEGIAQKMNKLANYTNYLSQHLNKSINHGDHIVENVIEMKNYLSYVTRKLDENISYSKYLSENVDKNTSYAKYLSKKVDQSINYDNYLAENINNLEGEMTNNRKYSEYIAEYADKGLQYNDYLAKKLDDSIQYTEHVGKVVNEAANYANYLGENVNNNINYSNYLAENLNDPKLNSLGEGSNYEQSLSNKLDLILESAKRQKVSGVDDKMHFLKFLDSDRISMFSSLNEGMKKTVIDSFSKNDYYNTSDAVRIFENAIKSSEPIFIKNMKPYHRELWNRLNESKKGLIVEQSKNYILKNQEQIDKFWDGVDFRSNKVELESINENEQKDKVATKAVPVSYMNSLEQEMLKRFGK